MLIPSLTGLPENILIGLLIALAAIIFQAKQHWQAAMFSCSAWFLTILLMVPDKLLEIVFITIIALSVESALRTIKLKEKTALIVFYILLVPLILSMLIIYKQFTHFISVDANDFIQKHLDTFSGPSRQIINIDWELATPYLIGVTLLLFLLIVFGIYRRHKVMGLCLYFALALTLPPLYFQTVLIQEWYAINEHNTRENRDIGTLFNGQKAYPIKTLQAGEDQWFYVPPAHPFLGGIASIKQVSTDRTPKIASGRGRIYPYVGGIIRVRHWNCKNNRSLALIDSPHGYCALPAGEQTIQMTYAAKFKELKFDLTAGEAIYATGQQILHVQSKD